MPFDVDLTVVSNVHKRVAPSVELRLVDMRGRDPWSLPFAHKEIFGDKVVDYDLFIYSEDDVLITERNIRAFLRFSAVLPQDEVPGFVRFERDAAGEMNFPDFHAHFHWDASSVQIRGDNTFAYFTNEHAGCYILTREQLLRAIASNGFLVGPHEGKYDLACTAATDPYTQCGFKKVICISDFRSFLVHHLPNKYVGRVGIDEGALLRQIDTLLTLGQNGEHPEPLLMAESRLGTGIYSKNYYEPVRREIISAIPARARTLLSIGCGWGAAEATFADAGLRVTAIPLDPVIPVRTVGKAIEIASGPLDEVLRDLAGRQFDCVLLTNVLHLVLDPPNLLCYVKRLLSPQGIAIIVSPNFFQAHVIWRRIRRDTRFKGIGDYSKTGVHWTSPRKLGSWVRDAGLELKQMIPLRRSSGNGVAEGLRRLIDCLLPPELLLIGGATQTQYRHVGNPALFN
jgi:2-polyprenyl-3-methyl-5-hydroxy-6-metoxy-1,4-benzoquinol methylase